MDPYAAAVLHQASALGVVITATPTGLHYRGMPSGRIGADLLADLRAVKSEIAAHLQVMAFGAPLDWEEDDPVLAGTLAGPDRERAYDRAERMAMMCADGELPPGWRCCSCGRLAWPEHRPACCCSCERGLTAAPAPPAIRRSP